MSAESASAIQRSQVDLLDFVDWSGVECLNQSSSHSLPNALKQGYREDDGLVLESDADEQLLIYIPFNQVVKLHSIVIIGPEEEGPQTVKLFSNKEHMGFSNVNDFPPSDTAVLSEDHLKGKPVILKYVKFQNVRSLTVFVEDNQSRSDVTKVQKIVLYGSTPAFFINSDFSSLAYSLDTLHAGVTNLFPDNTMSHVISEIGQNNMSMHAMSVFLHPDRGISCLDLRVETTDMKALKKIEDH